MIRLKIAHFRTATTKPHGLPHRPTDHLITKAEQRTFLGANDNQPLTVTEILRDNTPTRVYNFEVESQVGEITHNYLVGNDAAWVHNAGGKDKWIAIWLALLHLGGDEPSQEGYQFNPEECKIIEMVETRKKPGKRIGRKKK